MLSKEAGRKASRGDGPAAGAAGTSTAPAPPRVIAHRRGLPSGRAVAGGLLIALAALGAYVAATGGDGGPSTTYVVASHDLAPGQELSAQDVELVAIDLPPAQARGTYRSVAALESAVARGPIPGGALVTVADVAPSAHGGAYRELSVSLPRARALDGALVAGDRVDLVATADGASTAVVQDALVLAVSGDGGGALGGGDVVVTLALDDPAVALHTAHAAAATDVTLLRSTRAADRLPATTGVGT
ncbi:MAG: hypothetical protein GEV08_15325 [Acidimicrobiia bacterium]|nr:hypothetical protein [Acidimicrobiia bacterium]